MTKKLPFQAMLHSGEIVLVREIGPGDRPLLREGFARLSDHSRFLRFLGPHNALSEAELDRFTEANTNDHFGIGAVSAGVEADMPLATARFVRNPENGAEAEIAITIIDSHQRLGLGGLLLRTLACEGSRRGIGTFTALLHQDNLGMVQLLKRYGAQKIAQNQEMEWSLALPLKPRQDPLRGRGDFTIPGIQPDAV